MQRQRILRLVDTRAKDASSDEGIERPVLDALFAQVNDHLRATETKHLQISLGYMALLSLALSILATPGSNRPRSVIGHATSQQMIAYSALIAVGCMTVFIQDAYRGWKRHYQRVAKALADELAVDDRFLPYWLKYDPFDHPFLVRVSADNALTYFTAGATTVLVLILSFILHSLASSTGGRVALIGGVWIAYLAFLVFVRLRVYRRLKVFGEEDLLEAERRLSLPPPTRRSTA